MLPSSPRNNESPLRMVVVLQSRDWSSMSNVSPTISTRGCINEKFQQVEKQWESMKMVTPCSRKLSIDTAMNDTLKSALRPGMERGRWESMSNLTSPKKPSRRFDSDNNSRRNEMLATAGRWESMSSLLSPMKPSRRGSNGRGLSRSMSVLASPPLCEVGGEPKTKNQRLQMMNTAGRWESMSTLQSPMKPSRRGSNGGGLSRSMSALAPTPLFENEESSNGRRSQMMANAGRWESMTSLTSPMKPSRRGSNSGGLSRSMSALAPPPLFGSESGGGRSQMMAAAGRWESSASITDSVKPCKPHRQNSSDEGLVAMSASVCSASVGDDCRRKILTSRNWSSMRTSRLSLSRRSLISKTESRRSLMSQAERWESVSSDLSIAKPVRRVDKLTSSPRHRPTLQRTCSTALLSTPVTTRARKIIDSRGWRSFLERKNSLPRKALSSSEEYPCSPPLQITVQLETSTQASLDKINSLRQSLKEKREQFASTVNNSRRNLIRTMSGLSEVETIDTNTEAVHCMDPKRVMLMSKFKALNKGMNDALAQKQARLTRIRLLNAHKDTPPKSVSVVSNDDASDDSLTAAGISTQSGSADSTSTTSSSRMSLHRNAPLAKYLDSGHNSGSRRVFSDDDASEETLTAAGMSTNCGSETSSVTSSSRLSLCRNGPLAKYLDSGNNPDNRNRIDDASHKMSLPDLLSIREDDDDISDYFEDCSESESQ